MSSEHIPKVPDRPMRRRRTTDEIVQAEETSTSCAPAPDENQSDFPDNGIVQAPDIPLRRPQKAQTSPNLQSVPFAESLFKSDSEENVEKKEAPEIPLTRPKKNMPDERLDDILENTDAQLREMQDLINKHGKTKSTDLTATGPVDAVEDFEDEKELNDQDSCDEEISQAPNFDLSKQPGSTDLNQSDDYQNEVDQPSEETSGAHSLETVKSQYTRNGSNLELESPHANERLTVDNSSGRDIAADVESEQAHNEEEGVQGLPLIPRRPIRNYDDNKRGKSEDILNTNERDVPRIPARPIDTNEVPESDNGHAAQEEQQESHFQVAADDRNEIKLTKLNTSSSDSLSENGATKKRSAPPVPKKPSSRIAAFQEMLQKQQLEQLQGRSESVTTKRPSVSETPGIPHGRPSHHNKSSIGGDKAKFAQNLNGIFALPGMGAQNIPLASLNNTAGHPAIKEDNLDSKDGSLGDIRHNRARGPRGRKLPSKVSNVEKISIESNSNNIEVFNTWSIVYTKERKSRMKPQDITSSRREIPHHLADTIEGLVNAGIQERRPSLSEAQVNEMCPDGSESEPIINEATSFPKTKATEGLHDECADQNQKADESEGHRSEENDLAQSISFKGANEAEEQEDTSGEAATSD